MRRLLPITVLSLLLPALANAAGEPASVVDIRVVRDNGFVRVEITLSQPVLPVVKTTEAPERLVVVLPGTVSEARQKRIPVGAAGIKGVRMGLHSSDPPETDVVIDLEPTQTHSHGLRVQGNRIVLAVSGESTAAHRTAPARAGSVSPFVGALSKREAAPNLPPVDSAAASAPARTATMNPPTSSGLASTKQPVQGTSTSPATAAATAAGTQITAPGTVQLRAANRSTIESANAAAPALTMRVPNSGLRVAFTVKYVTAGAAYLDGGRSSGLAEGMKLQIKDDLKTSPAAPAEAAGSGGSEADGGKRIVADLEVISVAETSAVTEIKSPAREVKKGDLAYLSTADQAALVEQRTLSSTRKYPQVVSFTEGDPLEEEARAEVPRPPMPSVNRARGRIGFDYGGIHSGDGLNSTQVGMVARADITRIGGTYWNLSGFWRGRLQSQASNVQPTIQDLIDRTYTLSMTYDNPTSPWVIGFGRLYLPWAPSLDTIDGGYFGRRLHKGVTAGIFGGSSPDPASWNYEPGRRLAGTFINFEGGSFEGLRYTSTVGAGMSTVYGQFDKPLGFVESGLFYRRIISIYDSAQVDEPPANPAVPSPGMGLARSFVTVRIQPIERLSFDLNHNYFRDVPTFDPNLIGTGLLDKYLFQGFSGGVRGDVIRHVTLYTTLGASSRTGDVRNSINQMYGVTLDRIWRTGVRVDVHYSRFNSSFGDGRYEVISLSRNLGDRFHFEVLGGQQIFTSTATSDNSSHFLTSMMDVNLGARYFVSGGLTLQRGTMNYDQWFTMLGYRFDNRSNLRR